MVLSNRGPFSFSRDKNGELVSKRSGGGLASTLGPVLQKIKTTWITAAVTDTDREAVQGASQETVGHASDIQAVTNSFGQTVLKTLILDPARYSMAYDVVSNTVLWFCLHNLFDPVHQPHLDCHFTKAWEAYREINRQFAASAANEAAEDAHVLVQDYHLFLVGSFLAELRPDLSITHFTHTPFCSPQDLGYLPDPISKELLSAMFSYKACGFHAKRWEEAYKSCCRELLEKDPNQTFVAPLGPDINYLNQTVASSECTDAYSRINKLAGGNRLILRVDRIEPSKNILRGFLAFEEMMKTRADLREKVVFLAMLYSSRQQLAQYISYKAEIETLVKRINDTWSTKNWSPIILNIQDNHVHSVAALRAYDVLLVNPIKDGLNLIAKEGPIVNSNNGVVVLSNQTGAFEELKDHVIEVNPFDITQTAQALANGLDTGITERKQTAQALKSLISQRAANGWFNDLLKVCSL